MQKLIESGVRSFTIMEQLINEVAKKDKETTLSISDSYIGMDENTIECLVQSWEMINAAFPKKVRKKKSSQSRGCNSGIGVHGVPLLT